MNEHREEPTVCGPSGGVDWRAMYLAEVSESHYAIRQLSETRAERDKALKERDDKVAAWEELNGKLERLEKERDKAVRDRGLALIQRDAAIRARDFCNAQRKKLECSALRKRLCVILKQRDAAEGESQKLWLERNEAIRERNVARAERDGAIVDRDAALKERDEAIKERDSAHAAMVTCRHRYQTGYDAIVAERDAVKREREEIRERHQIACWDLARSREHNKELIQTLDERDRECSELRKKLEPIVCGPSGGVDWQEKFLADAIRQRNEAWAERDKLRSKLDAANAMSGWHLTGLRNSMQECDALRSKLKAIEDERASGRE